jgi:IclR family transcriptional regulator, acetate operon repressor
MLVYRDFAEQLTDRRYGSGPVLRGGTAPRGSVTRLRAVALPHLRGLVESLGETANVMVLAGSDVRFVATVECDHVLRVGDRTGRVLPAHLSSGGKAALALAGQEELAAALGALDVATAAKLERELRTVRRRGFAVNDQGTETGLTAVGVAVPAAGGVSGAAISVAAPSARCSHDLLPVWGAALTSAAAAIARDLDEP